MADLQGIFEFPGIKQFESCSYTLGHGITPGAFVVNVLPQKELIASIGTVALSFGRNRMEFKDCKVNFGTIQRDSRGNIVALQILDRRWKWTFPTISGWYNRRDDANEVEKISEKTPQELATLLLKAMGETRYDVSALPNKARPTVEWDVSNAAQELASLCDSLGCRIVLKLNGSVRIEKLGSGADLPDNDDLIESAQTIDPPEKPDHIEVVGGPTRVQWTIDLEAVGEDVDGRILPIDKLSYKPTGGWETTNHILSGVTSNPTSPRNPYRLALNSVFKWYRIKVSLADILQIDFPGLPVVYDRWQILPLFDQINSSFTNDSSGEEKRARPAYVQGAAWSQGFGKASNTGSDDILSFDFSLNTELGIVEFSEPVRKVPDDASGSWGAPTLRLTCSFNVRDYNTGALHRFRYQERTPGPRANTEAARVIEEELVLQVTGTERITGVDERPIEVSSNRRGAKLDDYAKYVFEGELQQFQTTAPVSASYNGLQSIDPDGAIQQVSWTINERGAETNASRDIEADPFVEGYRDRRRREKVSHVIAKGFFSPTVGTGVKRKIIS